MIVKLFILLSLVTSIKAQELLQITPTTIKSYKIPQSPVEMTEFQSSGDFFIQSGLTPTTFLSFKKKEDLSYDLSRISLRGGHYWPSRNLSIDGKIVKFCCTNNSVYMITNNGKLYEFDEETSHFSQINGTYVPTVIKANGSVVFVLEAIDQEFKTLTQFLVIGLIKNNMSQQSEPLNFPVTSYKDLIVKKQSDGIIIGARDWMRLFFVSKDIGVTMSAINFELPNATPLRLNSLTLDHLDRVLIHLVTTDRDSRGYLVAVAQNQTAQLLAGKNVLVVRKQLNGDIRILSAATPWAEKYYIQALWDYLRNNELVQISNESGQIMSEFRLQTSTFMGIPRLLKNGLILVCNKTRIGREISLFQLDGSQLDIPCLLAYGLKVFKDGSFIVAAKNTKKKWDWASHNTIMYYQSTNLTSVNIIDSPTPISIHDWRLV